MKYIILFVLVIWTSATFGTGQQGDRIIYKGDTLVLLGEPLEPILHENDPRSTIHIRLQEGCSTSLWRGYVALWKIEGGRLWLVDVYLCGNKNLSIKKNIFKDESEDIFADWFTGNLLIEKGKVIKYHHSAYDRYYETEIFAPVENGIIISENEYHNGVKPGDQRFSRDIYKIIDEIYLRLNWKKLPELSNKKRLFVGITLDSGCLKLDTIYDKNNLEEIYETELRRVIQEFPDVQIFYYRGKPLKEGYAATILFSRWNKRKHRS